MQPKELEDRQDRLNPHRCRTLDLARAQRGSIQSKSYTTKRSSTSKSKPCSTRETYRSLCGHSVRLIAMEQSNYSELKFNYPPGTSPFKAPSDVAEMNEALQESIENGYVVSFTIPQGSSRRTAMNISHHASNTFIRKVTLQAHTAHLASVKTLSSKQVSLQSCASLQFKQQEWPDLLGGRGPTKS